MPINQLPVEVIGQIIRGGEAACREAGIPIAGGHTIDSVEPIYGVVVMGLVYPSKVRRNANAKAGDVLILGKALGVGVLSAALNLNCSVTQSPRRSTRGSAWARKPIFSRRCDPALGRVGMTEREVRARGRPALMAMMAMQAVGRAREAGETQGFMKVLVDVESQRLLGASILGLNGDEAAHSPYTVISRAVHIHPTVTELVPTLLQKFASANVRPVYRAWQ